MASAAARDVLNAIKVWLHEAVMIMTISPNLLKIVVADSVDMYSC